MRQMHKTIIIPGQPVSKLRARAGKNRHGHKITYTPAKTKAKEETIGFYTLQEFKKPIPKGAPVEVEVEFYFACPKSDFRKRTPRPLRPHLKTPDLDNLIKLVKDALNGIAWHDDAQVWKIGTARKFYCGQENNNPRTVIRVNW